MAKQKFNFSKDMLRPLQAASSAPEAEVNHPSTNDTGAIVSGMIDRLDAPRQASPLDAYKIIPRNKLRNNRKNNYPVNEIESLKESILRFGLQQDITAAYITDEDMYVIETGHRRRLAIDELISEFAEYVGNDHERLSLYQKNVKRYEYGYVCKIMGTISENTAYDSDNEEDIDSLSDEALDSEIRLIITNQEVRSNDPVITAANIQRLAKLYQKKNIELPKNEKININQTIAHEMGIGVRNVAYLKNINNLIPELKEKLSNKNITLKEGSGIARLPEEEQREILQLLDSSDSSGRKTLKLALQEKEAVTKELESLRAAGAASQVPPDILKADALMRSSMEQAKTGIKYFLQNIASLQRLQAGENTGYGSSHAEVEAAKQELIKMLS